MTLPRRHSEFALEDKGAPTRPCSSTMRLTARMSSVDSQQPPSHAPARMHTHNAPAMTCADPQIEAAVPAQAAVAGRRSKQRSTRDGEPRRPAAASRRCRWRREGARAQRPGGVGGGQLERAWPRGSHCSPCARPRAPPRRQAAPARRGGGARPCRPPPRTRVRVQWANGRLSATTAPPSPRGVLSAMPQAEAAALRGGRARGVCVCVCPLSTTNTCAEMVCCVEVCVRVKLYAVADYARLCARREGVGGAASRGPRPRGSQGDKVCVRVCASGDACEKRCAWSRALGGRRATGPPARRPRGRHRPVGLTGGRTRRGRTPARRRASEAWPRRPRRRGCPRARRHPRPAAQTPRGPRRRGRPRPR